MTKPLLEYRKGNCIWNDEKMEKEDWWDLFDLALSKIKVLEKEK